MDSDARTFFCASQDFRSGAPSARLPAIAKLLALAQNGGPPLRSRAVAVLVKEFGPYAVTHGLPGCAAPISEVVSCGVENRDCRDCSWIWLPQADETLAEAI